MNYKTSKSGYDSNMCVNIALLPVLCSANVKFVCYVVDLRQTVKLKMKLASKTYIEQDEVDGIS